MAGQVRLCGHTADDIFRAVGKAECVRICAAVVVAFTDAYLIEEVALPAWILFLVLEILLVCVALIAAGMFAVDTWLEHNHSGTPTARVRIPAPPRLLGQYSTQAG